MRSFLTALTFTITTPLALNGLWALQDTNPPVGTALTITCALLVLAWGIHLTRSTR